MRKAAVTPIARPNLDEEALSRDMQDVDRRNQQVAKLDERFGSGLPYDRRRLVLEARSIVVLTGEALLELGKRLLLLKEHEPHGEFLQALGEIGVADRFARKAMQAALKFGQPNRPSTADFAGLGQGKLIELLVLDDEEIAELKEGGTVVGLALDQIDRMSTRELRAKLRKHVEETKKERDVNERLLADKNKKIDELDAKLARREAAPEAERNQALIKELWDSAFDVAGSQIRLLKVFRAINETHPDGRMPLSIAQAREQGLSYLMQLLIELQEQFGIQVNLEDMVSPPWMKEFHERVQKEVGPVN